MQDYNLVPYQYNVNAELLTGQTESTAVSTDYSIDLGMLAGKTYATTLLGVYVPAGFDGTALGIQASPDGVTYSAMINVDTGADASFRAAPGKYVPIAPYLTAGVKYLKFKTDVAQTSDIELTVVLRRVL